MRSLHTVEEKLYAPDSPLDYRAKVLLYIRHETIRWDDEDDVMSYSEMAKKTGVPPREVKEAVKFLESKGLITVLRRKQGKLNLPNVLGLNPKYFGDLIEVTCRPKLSVIPGGRDVKLSTVVPNSTPPLVPNSTPPLVPVGHHKMPAEPLPEPQGGHLKNPFKEQFKKLLGGNQDFFSQESRERDAEDHRQKVIRQVAEFKRLEAEGKG